MKQKYRTRAEWAELAIWADKKAEEFERAAAGAMPDGLTRRQRDAHVDSFAREAAEGRRFRRMAEQYRVKAHTGS